MPGGGDPSSESTVAVLGKLYRDLTVAWDAASADPRKANKIFDEQHRVYKRLRETPAGRLAISALIQDDVIAVRLSAATHSLAWDEERAVRVLEELVDHPSLHGVSAKWTLRTFRAGKLDLDW